jgi:hypothetical protein
MNECNAKAAGYFTGTPDAAAGLVCPDAALE